MNSLRLILSRLRYFAPAWVFSSLNIMTGTWVLYIPHVKEKFQINDGQIGVALFCLAMGALLTIPTIPWFNKNFGVGRCTIVGIVCFALAYVMPLIATSYVMLCALLFVVGIFSSFTDVSMNALVSTIEKEDGQNFMSAAHGFFSLGGIIGAGIGSLLILKIAPVSHMALMAAAITVINLALVSQYLHVRESDQAKNGHQASFFSNIMPLLALSLIAFIVMWNESSTEHWSALFMKEIILLPEQKAGLGFILFSTFMTLGRFFGDGISAQYGSKKIILAGTCLAILAHGLIITSSFYTSLMGFGLLGLGLSVIIPELFRLAGNVKGVSASYGISVVSGIGFMGFLVGPVILGLVSNALGLVMSFGVLLGSLVVCLIFVGRVKS